MKLNHLNLTVTDVSAAETFLKTYFGLQSEEGDDHRKNFVVMYDDNKLVLGLMKAGHGVEVKYPGYFHIGFIQESEEHVTNLYHRLKEDGFDVQPPERHHAWTFYIQAPGGFTVEVLA
jgi:catechol-2,3-dioxygenase